MKSRLIFSFPWDRLVAFPLVVISCSSSPEINKPVKDVPVSIPFTGSSLEFAGMIGTWTNVDPKTNHLTRVEIVKRDSSAHFLIRMWASCQPEDCFWGANTSGRAVEGKTGKPPELSLEWEFEFSVASQTIRLIGKDLLEIDTNTQSRSNADFQVKETDRFRLVLR